MRPICVKCHRIMNVDKIGIDFIEIDGKNDPYRVWSTDRFKCPVCGIMVLYTPSINAYVYNFDDSFLDTVANALQQEDTVIERR